MDLFLHVTYARCKLFIRFTGLFLLLWSVLWANPVSSAATAHVKSIACTPPGAAASVSGTLSCNNNTVVLMGSSPAADVSYAWVGPEGFSSAAQAITVSVHGVYILTVTTPENDCASSATVIVQADQVAPGVVITACGGALTCSTTSVSLGALSPTPGAMYHWTGPDGYASTEQNPVTTIPGNYTVTVTNPVNGCTSSAATVVEQQAEAPGSVAATVSGPLTCTVNSVTLMGASTIPGGTFQWTGPNGFTATTQHVSTSVPGEYTLTVANPVNNCTASTTATVIQSKTLPSVGAISSSSGFILTCFTYSTRLLCSSPVSGATYKWTNSAGTVLSTTSSYTVNVTVDALPETYTFTVTNPVNGCTNSRSRVMSKVLIPQTATTTVSGDITCVTPVVTLSATTSGTPVTYSWIGPSGFTSTLQNPVVNAGGVYTLTTTTDGGCTATSTIEVKENITAPANVTATVSGILNCTGDPVMLQASSSTAEVLYYWEGPGFSSSEPNAEITVAGEYRLTVTNPVSGCQVTKSVTVVSQACNSNN